MYSKMLIIVFFGLMMLFGGCNTAKGVSKAAVEGIQQDWKELNAADGWVKENLW